MIPTKLLLALLLLASTSFLPAAVRAAVSCSTVYNALLPCQPYVETGGTAPPTCCGGIRSLLSQARTTRDRRTVCSCLKNLANVGASSGTYVARAAALPGKCGVSVPFKISTNVNCNTIK